MATQKEILKHSIRTETAVSLADQPSFEEAVKKWVQLDNTINYHQQNLKTSRLEKTSLTPQILDFLERNKLQSTTINIHDGTLKYSVETSLPSFSQKFLFENLKEYFKQCGEDEKRAEDCMEFLKKARVPKVQGSIKREYNND